MRVLVLGGTAFLSRTVAAEAVARGHEVVCAARGTSGAVADGSRLVVWDRSEEVPAELVEFTPGAVVDVARVPSYVRRAVAAFPEAHWSFVSTTNVYADTATPGQTADAELVPAIAEDVDPASSVEAYGGMKVACEQIVREGASAAFVVRPGLVIGPGDVSGRFAYWPSRVACAVEDRGPLLAPGAPTDPVQFVDVRDLAAWIVDAAERRLTGTFTGVGPTTTREEFLDGVSAGVGGAPRLRWVPTPWLAEHGVEEWMGPRSLPVWVSSPGHEGFMLRDVTASLAAGLRVRPVAETARDTLAWLRAEPDAVVTGLTRDEELELLAIAPA